MRQVITKEAPRRARTTTTMIGLIGLDHHWAPTDVRGRLSFTGERLTDALQSLAGAPEIAEAVLLSTCNRTEVYIATPDLAGARTIVERFLAHSHAAGPDAPVTPIPATTLLTDAGA